MPNNRLAPPVELVYPLGNPGSATVNSWDTSLVVSRRITMTLLTFTHCLTSNCHQISRPSDGKAQYEMIASNV